MNTREPANIYVHINVHLRKPVRKNLVPYEIEITQAAINALEGISDTRSRAAIVRRIEALTEEPEKLGKPLQGDLRGFLSSRAAGQRYRVVFRIDEDAHRVVVYMVGIRKEGGRRDVYALAQRLVRRGLI